MFWLVYWLHGSPLRAVRSLKEAAGGHTLNTGEFNRKVEIVTVTPSTGLCLFGCTAAAGNIPSGVSAARSEPACCLAPASTPAQNLKHDNINAGYLVIVLKCSTTWGGKNYTYVQSKSLENYACDSSGTLFGPLQFPQSHSGCGTTGKRFGISAVQRNGFGAVLLCLLKSKWDIVSSL